MPSCLGLGLVRAIDLAHQALYIVTPLPLARLQACNILLKGSLQMPLSMMFGSRLGLPSPYLSCEVATTGEGAEHLRPRVSIARRGRETSGG